MSTEKSLKHLKSKDEFLVANVSNYFEKHSGRDSSSYTRPKKKRRIQLIKKIALNESGKFSSSVYVLLVFLPHIFPIDLLM